MICSCRIQPTSGLTKRTCPGAWHPAGRRGAPETHVPRTLPSTRPPGLMRSPP